MLSPHVYHLAKESGATNEQGGSIGTGAICFTRQEFEEFVRRLAEFQCEAIRQQAGLS